jgi:CRISPR-associated protein Cas5h
MNLPDGAKVIVFEIWGDYGLFKKPYTPMSPVSFPIPPPTAIFGIVGAIAGWSKEEYLGKINSGDVAVGVRVINPVQRFRTALNLLDTSESFRLKDERRVQIPFEFLRDPHFRILFYHSNREVIEPLVRALSENRPVFSPCLGLANCLAEVRYNGLMKVSHKPGGEKIGMTCVVPLNDGRPTVHYELSGRSITRLSLPSRMLPDRKILKYQEVVIGEEGEEQRIVVDVEGYYECGEETLLFF